MCPECSDDIQYLDIVEERYLLTSTIITSQLLLDQWYGVFDEPTIADAVCDRLFHNAHKILLKRDSMRKNDTRSVIT